MQISATQISYLHTCHRKLWLFSHHIQMEHTSDVVYEGKLTGEMAFAERAAKNVQLELDGVKIDFYDAKTRTVHETKKSDKMEQAHVAQVKYYLYVLQKNGVEGARGIIEYPRLRERTEVPPLDENDLAEIEAWLEQVQKIIERESCPPVINKPVCKQCSYFDFCYCAEP